MKTASREHSVRYLATVVMLVTTSSACSPRGGSTMNPTDDRFPAQSQLAGLPLGELAGADELAASPSMGNPLSNDAAAVAEGRRLFVAMNCAGCHGYDAKGAMGPDLTDSLWRYGGTPVGIYKSIFDGRPQGMPAWGRSLPAQEIWKITAYLQTLGGALDAQAYHAGLQGDHQVTSVAPEAHAFDGPLTASHSTSP